MDALRIPPEIAAPLTGRYSGAQVIVVMLMQRVERLRVWIANEVIEMLRLAKARMLRTRWRVMMRGERGREVRRLKIGGSGQRRAPVMGHPAAVSIASVTVVMSAGIRRGISTAQRGNAPVTSQSVLFTENIHFLNVNLTLN